MPSTFVYRFSDVDKIQDGIGEKLGQFFQYFATFVCGFVIGFIYGWQLTLVIIAVSPLLAIAGGLMAAVSRHHRRQPATCHSRRSDGSGKAMAGLYFPSTEDRVFVPATVVLYDCVDAVFTGGVVVVPVFTPSLRVVSAWREADEQGAEGLRQSRIGGRRGARLHQNGHRLRWSNKGALGV